jgi:hypothetical protein
MLSRQGIATTAIMCVLILACPAAAAVETHTGHLADRYCVDKVVAPDGANMMTGPAAHSVECALLAACQASGFTLLMQTPGQTSYGDMYNLTAAGNIAAIAYLSTLPTARKNILVHVTGSWSGGLFAVTSITDAAPATVTGFLADRLCVDKVVAPDGANMITSPEAHSVMCALLAKCIASGYTVLEPPAMGVTYGALHNLTAAGNEVSLAYLRTLPDSRKNIAVVATGTHLKDGTFDLVSLRDAAPVLVAGFLADRLCVDKVVAPDGANMISSPEVHTVMCALLAKCVASGYTILQHARGQTAYGGFVNLTARGNAMAVAYLRRLPPMRADLRVAAKGTLLRSGLFDVISLHEAAPVTINGFLADRLCVDLRIALDNADMVTHPEEHTVMCSLMPICVASGFTVLKHTAGQTAYGAMYNLTFGGNALALAHLKKLSAQESGAGQLPGSKKDIRVDVTGTHLRNGQFEATGLLAQVAASTAAAPTTASPVSSAGVVPTLAAVALAFTTAMLL